MKYDLVGIDGNAYAIMGYVVSCMEKEKLPHSEVECYYSEAQSSDYNNLLRVSMKMIDRLNLLAEAREE